LGEEYQKQYVKGLKSSLPRGRNESFAIRGVSKEGGMEVDSGTGGRDGGLRV